ncbi:MAG: hypothetical protein ACLTYN_03760 [Dysosmobacter welbionis]
MLKVFAQGSQPPWPAEGPEHQHDQPQHRCCGRTEEDRRQAGAWPRPQPPLTEESSARR